MGRAAPAGGFDGMRIRDRFIPDPDLGRDAMEALQRDIREAALFRDAFDPGPGDDPAVIAGIDQAFLDGDRAVSAVVVIEADEVVERTHAVTSVSFPYVPGLLSFREGGPIVEALRSLDRVPDLLMFDGSGRIHYREAGLATHIGVAVDRPSIGVAKRLLCGTPRADTDGLATGDRVPIEADGDVTAPDGTVIGYAVQTRQYETPNRHVNPVFVSPGHRISATTAADIVSRHATGYKLPEPTRLADRYANEVKDEYT